MSASIHFIVNYVSFMYFKQILVRISKFQQIQNWPLKHHSQFKKMWKSKGIWFLTEECKNIPSYFNCFWQSPCRMWHGPSFDKTWKSCLIEISLVVLKKKRNSGKHWYLELDGTSTKIRDIWSCFPILIPWCVLNTF